MKSFPELTGKEKSIELLRWCCVPVASLLGIVALRIIAGLVMSPALAHLSGAATMSTSDFGRVILHGAFRTLTATVFVITGAKTAQIGRAHV